MANITDRLVRSIQPEDYPYEIRDGKLRGFILRVQPSGVVSYVVQVRRGERITLGRRGELTPEAARKKANAAIGKAAEGMSIEQIRAALKPEPQNGESQEEATAPTLRTLLKEKYAPWAKHHLKVPDREIDRIKSRFADFLDDPIEQITGERLDEWRLNRLNDGVSLHTVARDLACLRAAWKRLPTKLYPFEDMNGEKALPDNKRIRFLEPHEELALRKALLAREDRMRERRKSANEWRRARDMELLPDIAGWFADHLRPMVLISVNTGLRWGELTSLEWADIDLERNTLRVRAAAAKSSKPRTIPLSEEALVTFREWKSQTGDTGIVFKGKEGARFDNVKRAWGNICDSVKLENFRWHDLRHTFASKLVQAGVDLNVVRELMGHADLQMTLRYAHLRHENLADAVAKLVPPAPTSTEHEAKQTGAVA